jgi:hypothetical protein
MELEMKNKIRPLYSELQGYLSQAPDGSDPNKSTNDESLWQQFNITVDELSSVTNQDFGKFKINPLVGSYNSFIFISTYRQKVGGLISRLHGEYFFDEPAPFSGMPSTIITQTQHQAVSIQMLLDIQSKIDENLLKVEEKSKKEGFLKKFKSVLSTASNVNELIRICMKLASEFGLNIHDILSLWGG